MKPTRVAIVGGGLSGIQTALLLQHRGIDCVVLEARDRLGGRILSVPASPPPSRPETPQEARAVDQSPSRHDLGPAWYWPEFQPRMAQLVQRLHLQAFAQHTQGAMLFERSSQQAVERYPAGFHQEPRSMRLAGGMLALLEALSRQLPADCIRLNAEVNEIRLSPGGSLVLGLRGAGTPSDGASPTGNAPQTIEADHVILALPPRLAQERITFVPDLVAATRQAWQTTPTWMAGHAKALAVYPQPFWRQAGLSGMVSSQVGPLVEIHDASAYAGLPALFGFVGIPAHVRATMPVGTLRAAVEAQLERLFGAQAAQPVDLWLQDWANETHTATGGDWVPPGSHPTYGFALPHRCLWEGRLLLAGTEAAPVNGGYLEGALEAAEQAVDRIPDAAPFEIRSASENPE